MHHPLVEFREVSYSFGQEPVVEGLTLQIPEGAFVGVVGPSGAGKTTFLRLAAGMLRPSTGEVRFAPNGDGRRIRLAVVPQTETIDWNFPITVEEVVLLGQADRAGLRPWATRGARGAARDLLERLGIGPLAHRHIRNLSGGQQQRAFIARALLRRPDLLLLDEPTSGVDVKTRHDVLHLLHELNHDGIGIVLTTHDLPTVAAHLPSLICLNRRVVAAGTPREVLTAENLRDLYGADMVVVEREGILLIGDVPTATVEDHDPTEHPRDIPVAHFGETPPPHDHGPAAGHRHEEPVTGPGPAEPPGP